MKGCAVRGAVPQGLLRRRLNGHHVDSAAGLLTGEVELDDAVAPVFVPAFNIGIRQAVLADLVALAVPHAAVVGVLR